jgi:hypothetical protein
MVRVSPGAALGAADPAARARYTLLATAVDGAAAVALMYDASDARLIAARVGEDPAASATAVVRAGASVPSTLALRGDGVAFVTRREPAAHGGARIVVSQVTCARENP